MVINKINLKSGMRSCEIDTINCIAKYLWGFDDSLLVERELDLDEIQLLYLYFNY
ncbi:hypothetical protein BHECKSOX2_936 [Bathymodiolus heckerae thiotrophic gill symbiont]|nr:hypothetical protein BHECKSOX2_936 [Bathymodiolus heckerae thiotrophic gill symbiont]